MRLVVFCSTLLIAFLGFAAPPMSVWPVDALVKVFPDDAPGTNRAADRLWLTPRNGHVSIQFAVRASMAVEALEVDVTLGGGLQTQVRRAGYVPVRANPPGTPAD